MKLLYLPVYPGNLLFAELATFPVVAVPIITELVGFDLLQGVFLLAYHFCQFLVLRHDIVKELALVHAVHIVAVLSILVPHAEAIPAELVVADFTVRQFMPAMHTNAAMVLLNWILAHRALFSVRFDPHIVRVAVFFLVEPDLNLLAVGRGVLFLLALDAEEFSTAALGVFAVELLRQLDVLFAAASRTTLDVSIRVGELAAVPLDVFCHVGKLLLIDK